MVPESISPFLTASAGAAATLIGLLSVANSIIGQKDKNPEFNLYQGILAESAYGAFATVFFITLSSLIPGINIGYIACIMAIVGFLTIWNFVSKGLHRLRVLNKNRARVSSGLLWVSIITYVVQFAIGAAIIVDPTQDHLILLLAYGILMLYGIGLARAWELLGVRDIFRNLY